MSTRLSDSQLVFFTGEIICRQTLPMLIHVFRLANCISMVTLTIAAAMFTQYWGPNLGIAPATFVLLIIMVMMNACGVRVGTASEVNNRTFLTRGKLYGNLEWIFKWFKIFLILFLCVTMFAIKVGGQSLYRLRSECFRLMIPGGPRRINTGCKFFASSYNKLSSNKSTAFEIARGYSPTAFFGVNGTISTLPRTQSDIPIPGTGGRILAVWYVSLAPSS